MRFLASVAVFFAWGCAAQNTLTCNGSSCTCPADSMCTFSPITCGPTSCSLACGAHTACSGRCSDSCSITCEDGSRCDVSVAHSGSVSCQAGADCNVTCPYDCSVSCASGATCTIRCATDAAPHGFTGSASCS